MRLRVDEARNTIGLIEHKALNSNSCNTAGLIYTSQGSTYLTMMGPTSLDTKLMMYSIVDVFDWTNV